MNNKNLLAVAIQAAQLGGEILRAHLHEAHTRRIDAKSEFDFVTNVDHASEAAVVAHVQKHFPEHKILAEESGAGFTEHDDFWSTGNILASNNLVHVQMEKLVRAGL